MKSTIATTLLLVMLKAHAAWATCWPNPNGGTCCSAPGGPVNCSTGQQDQQHDQDQQRRDQLRRDRERRQQELRRRDERRRRRELERKRKKQRRRKKRKRSDRWSAQTTKWPEFSDLDSGFQLDIAAVGQLIVAKQLGGRAGLSLNSYYRRKNWSRGSAGHEKIGNLFRGVPRFLGNALIGREFGLDLKLVAGPLRREGKWSTDFSAIVRPHARFTWGPLRLPSLLGLAMPSVGVSVRDGKASLIYAVGWGLQALLFDDYALKIRAEAVAYPRSELKGRLDAMITLAFSRVAVW